MSGQSHWIVRVARGAGLPGADALQVPARTPPPEAWSAVTSACGVGEDELAAIVARWFKLDVADFENLDPTATRFLPGPVARRFGVFPVAEDERRLTVATADPCDVQAEQQVGFASGRTPTLQIAPPGRIADSIEATYSPGKAVDNLLNRMDAGRDPRVKILEEEAPAPEPMVSLDGVDDATDAGPIVKLTNMILEDAVTKSASDIHLQPLPTGGVIRLRIDGVLRSGITVPLPVLARVISRIKIISRLDISDKMRPQDGRSRIRISGRTYDLRISTVPVRGGEKAVIRILDPHKSGALDESGLPAREVERLRRVLRNRDGILVVTGPTGSGKTTTMYAALREIATEDVNIMTVEDPVEYELPGLTQIQVEPKQGVTFASALRAILRQDPDVIFVGEIRDLETAEMAAQASLTGHLVLATLHTNDAVGAVRRFADLGLDSATVADSLRASLAQRLLRRVCPDCAQPVAEPLTSVERHLMKRFGVAPTVRAVGCDACAQHGYRGRLPVMELFLTSPVVQKLILEGAPPYVLQEQVRAEGMATLLDSALQRVRDGETTLEEVARVVGDEGHAGADAASEAVASERPEMQPAPGAPPRAPVPPPAPVAFAAGPPMVDGEEQDEGLPRILVVDDDGATRNIARGLLAKEGFRVSEAADGSEALVQLARGDAIDLMVLDLDMPMLGGREVLRAVRASRSTAGLPVVVLTGTPDPGAEIELMEQGADDYIRKPIDPPRFLTRVKAALRRARG